MYVCIKNYEGNLIKLFRLLFKSYRASEGPLWSKSMHFHFVCFVFEFVPKKSKNNLSTTELLYLLFSPSISKILLLDFAVFNPRHSCQVLVEERQTEQQSSPKSTPDEQTAASTLG